MFVTILKFQFAISATLYGCIKTYVNEIVLQASTHMGRRNCTISNNSVAYCSILVGPVLSDAVMLRIRQNKGLQTERRSILLYGLKELSVQLIVA